MIEIDLVPAPTAPSASHAPSPGAADDFAAALHDAGGREPAPRSDGAPDRDRESTTATAAAESSATEATDPSATSAASPAAETDDVDADPSTPTDEAEPATEVPAVDGLAIPAADATLPQPAVERGPDPIVASPTTAIETDAEVEIDPTPVVEESPAGIDVAVDEAAIDAPSLPDGAPVVAEVLAGAQAQSTVSAAEGETPIAATTEPLAEPTVAGPVDAAAADAVGVEGDVSPATIPAVASDAFEEAPPAPLDVVAESTVGDVPATVPVADQASTMSDADGPTPAPAAQATATAASLASGEATAALAAEVATPTQVAPPPNASTIDPLAAADAAAAAELDIPTPPQQIAEALRDVRRMADGSHRLSLQLHPEELGVVQLEVAVRDGQLHLRAATELDSTRRLLTASLPELREQLADAGVSAGSLEVGAETAGRDRSAGDGEPAATPRGGFDDTPTIDSSGGADVATLTAPGRLDVRL